MDKRIVRRKARDDIAGLEKLHPLLQRIYRARDIQTVDDLERDLTALPTYSDLLQVDRATERLAEALKAQQRILIVGDFDADGATSTAVAVKALKSFGDEHVDYLVPNRFEYGYGLTPEIVNVAAAAENKPDLIITVDNGIASLEGVDRANEHCIDVIITDHHLPGETLPKACAIVNPNQPNDSFSSKCLAGVGVTFYLMLALRAHLREQGWFEEKAIPCPNMTTLLDLVALGTVADVVPLDKVNRTLVHQGLRRIRAGLACPGITALMSISRRQRSQMMASDLGFAIAPRLNAAGRLEDMSFGIACLLSEDLEAAMPMAERLNALNVERRAIEAQMREEAYGIIEKLDLDHVSTMGLCLYDKGWHQGVVGLVASRVKEKLHRPVIAFSKVDDEKLKGSARSVKGVHIRDVLDSIATQNPGLITKFGGHAMAAGLSLPIKNYDAFQSAFSEAIAKLLKADDLQKFYETDGELSNEEFTLANAILLQEAGPWGQGFPAPLFDGEFRVIDQRIVGEKHLKLMLQATGASHYVDAIAFHIDLDKWPNHHCQTVHLVYRLDVNYYRDQKRLQLLIEGIWDTNLDASKNRLAEGTGV